MACHCVMTIEILDLEQAPMLAQVLQIFLGKEHLVENWLISTLDKVIYFKGTFLQGFTRPLLRKIGRRPAEKNSSIFFNMRLLDLRFLWS
jgi:hypothetical protein